MEAEIEVIRPQAKGYKDGQPTPEIRKKQRSILFYSLQREHGPANSLI